MKATIVGIQSIDFKDRDGELVKLTKYHLVVDTDEIEGNEVDTLSWNELVKGSPPSRKLNDIVDVEYNKRGKLKFRK